MRFPEHPADPSFVNPGPEAQRAHDALIAIEALKAVHEPCDLCPDPIKKEVAKVADDRTYTEVEHLALMADAVTRETASLTEAKDGAETKVTELSARVEVLEAEKATLETAKADADKALEDYKAGIEQLAALEKTKAERKDAVKAANEALPETYFTDERTQRWAAMTEEGFTEVLDGIKAAAGLVGSKETAAFSGGESPTDKTSQVTAGSIFALKRGKN